MASPAFTSNPGTVDTEGLLFRRVNSLASLPQNQIDPGAVVRFYRHIYPALAVEPGVPQTWLKSLIQQNSGLR